jgi:hypothetical protein
MNYSNTPAYCKLQFEKTLLTIEERGHIYVEGTYVNRESKLTVYCIFHDKLLETTFTNYNRSKTGCLFCGRKIVSKALTGRIFNDETIVLMRDAANNRPLRGGRPRRWRETTAYRNYRQKVMEFWKNECAITGYKNQSNEQILVVHHLISANSNDELVLNPLNGIVIQDYLHVKFHNSFGYRNNTIQQFKDFLLQLPQVKNELKSTNNISIPISSQEELNNSYGSETKIYDYNKIIEILTLLDEIEKKLK